MNLQMFLEAAQGKIRSIKRYKTDWGRGEMNPFNH